MLKATVVALLLMSASLFAQPPQVIAEKGKDHFETEFGARKHLKLEVRSGEVRIKGSDSNHITIHFDGRRSSEREDVEVKFRPTSDGAALRISGGPRNEFTIEIEIPRETNLSVRMPFGELTLDRIQGDKNVELHAGEVNIDLGDPKDYARIEASVYTGEINSGPMAISKGGLFRSFEKSGTGKYKLYAHVGSGELNLN